ncbi:hypothetical protein DL98DRAFT_510385 [Cadophora sp. DSE1049]|nr:hypothetical protein DL98DRAFT_510385 [Cadophora sp. DSE1049]
MNHHTLAGINTFMLHKITLSTESGDRYLKAIPLGRLFDQGKPSKWVVYLDSSGALLALLPDSVDKWEDELCGTDDELEAIGEDNDEHVCLWKESLLPDFGNPEIVFVHFGHLDSLQNRTSDFSPEPDRDVKSWKSQYYVATDQNAENDATNSAEKGKDAGTRETSEDELPDAGKQNITGN